MTAFTPFYNITHHIHFLRFGNSVNGIDNPLNDHVYVQNSTGLQRVTYRIGAFETIVNKKNHAFQYSANQEITEIENISRQRVGISFPYKVNPIALNLTLDEKTSTSDIILWMFAIFGGAVTLMNLFNRFIHRIFEPRKRVPWKPNY